MSQQKAPTVAGSASGARQGPPEAQQSNQANGSWSLLSKMYGSQMLSYMVAIDDAKAIMDRMRHMRPGKSGQAAFADEQTLQQYRAVHEHLQAAGFSYRSRIIGRYHWTTAHPSCWADPSCLGNFCASCNLLIMYVFSQGHRCTFLQRYSA